MTSLHPADRGLSLAPFRALRYRTLSGQAGSALGDKICPPYDVISEADRKRLVQANASNAVRLVLPGLREAELGAGDPYRGARVLLDRWVKDRTLELDETSALYVYEMQDAEGAATRGLLGAVELRDPADGVILPHENTMAGPVSDRLALMTATEANLEPIYLVYDGGGAASAAVAAPGQRDCLTEALTPDGMTHRLWSITDPEVLAEIAADLSSRRALIADGHHRYATYRQLQATHSGETGPWDRGLTLLVDTTRYGPKVHPIHRVVRLRYTEAVRLSRAWARVSEPMPLAQALMSLSESSSFAVVLAGDSDKAVLLTDIDPSLVADSPAGSADQALASLDVSLLHHTLVQQIWRLNDDEDTVGYAHDVPEALAMSAAQNSTAVFLRATPIAAVAQVAAAGARMPRKSTLFTPKPASGMVIRRFLDQYADQ